MLGTGRREAGCVWQAVLGGGRYVACGVWGAVCGRWHAAYVGRNHDVG